jgi:hypothetical protein
MNYFGYLLAKYGEAQASYCERSFLPAVIHQYHRFLSRPHGNAKAGLPPFLFLIFITTS